MSVRNLLSPAPADAAASSPQKFEELVARLEQIVSDMETADLPLDELLARYEEGMGLVKSCGEKLAEADQKMEILSRSVAVAESRSVSEPTVQPEEPKPAEDIRLI